jgi:hypothetical protein
MQAVLCQETGVKWVKENAVSQEHDGVCAFFKISLDRIEERKERQDVC